MNSLRYYTVYCIHLQYPIFSGLVLIWCKSRTKSNLGKCDKRISKDVSSNVLVDHFPNNWIMPYMFSTIMQSCLMRLDPRIHFLRLDSTLQSRRIYVVLSSCTPQISQSEFVAILVGCLLYFRSAQSQQSCSLPVELLFADEILVCRFLPLSRFS